MADPSRTPEAQPPGVPRWVKISAIVAAVIVVIVVLIAVLGGGEHGPGRHLPGGGGSMAPHEQR